MNEAALGTFLIYMVLTFGVRTAIHYRKTGASGFVGLSGRVGSPEWAGGVLFAAAILLGLLAPALATAGIVGANPAFDSIRPVGLAICAIGLLLTLLAQRAMGESWRIGVDANERTEFVAAGPFAIVRNPIFSAMIVFSLGLLLAVPSWIAALAFVSLMIALELQTRAVEEPYLLAAHGRTYAEYASRVGRFVPGVGRIDTRPAEQSAD